MEVILNHPQATDNSIVIKAQVSSVFGFLMQVCPHTLKIGLKRHAPFLVEPSCSSIH
ncbi:MAG: hypothetical protein IJK93_10660 [Muribaculaceae bacterium]|nr:hypothetical protein [Muribaculaceae bacterium]